MTNPTPPPAPALTAEQLARLRDIDAAPPAPESYANQRTSQLLHPITGALVAVYDPVIHGDDARWLAVTCSRCSRQFVNTPWDELMTPARDLAHDGDVCEPCLYQLTRTAFQRRHLGEQV